MRRILLLLLLVAPCAHAEFCGFIDRGATSQRLEIDLYRSDTGQIFTGLTSASAGLTISVKSNASATATTYTQAGGTIEAIATIPTFAEPTATKIAIKETDIAGVYALYGDNDLWAVTGSTMVTVGIRGVTSLMDKRCQYYQDAIDVPTIEQAAADGVATLSLVDQTMFLANSVPDAEIATAASQTAILDALDDLPADILSVDIDGISFENHLSFQSSVMYGCMNASGDVRTFQDPACTAARVAIDYSTGGRSAIVLTPP